MGTGRRSGASTVTVLECLAALAAAPASRACTMALQAPVPGHQRRLCFTAARSAAGSPAGSRDRHPSLCRVGPSCAP